MPVSVCGGAEAVVAVEDVFLVGMLVAPRTAGGRGQSLSNIQKFGSVRFIYFLFGENLIAVVSKDVLNGSKLAVSTFTLLQTKHQIILK